MPWQKRSVVSIREELVLKALAGEESKVDLAAKFGVSRKTVYKWLDRYKERGLAGLVDESRRPRSSPMMTSPELALAAVQLRKAHRSWGPKKIVAAGEAVPGRRDPVGLDREPDSSAGWVRHAPAPSVVGRLSGRTAPLLAGRAERPLDGRLQGLVAHARRRAV